MKILHCVESYYPALGGMQEVVKQLSERLSRLGHEVTVATRKHENRSFTEKEGVKIIDFDISGNLVNGIKGDKKGYEEFLLNSDFDIVTFFAAQQWATDVALPILSKIKGKKVSVPTGYSGLYWPEYAGYFENMKTWIQGYDMNVYLSNDYRDINFARANNVRNLTLIANGAAEDEFLPATETDVRKELGIGKEDFLILHVGSYTGWKGHQEAIDIFLRSIIKKGTLLMIGNNYESFHISKRNHPFLFLRYKLNSYIGRKKIIFKYYPRDFTVAAYRQSDLFMFPSNIECSPIVLFECAAAKLPFISTDVGNSVEIAQWTQGGMIMPTIKKETGFSYADIKGSVKLLNSMYGNRILLNEMATKAHKIWKEKYSWEKITLQYEKLYSDLIKGKL